MCPSSEGLFFKTTLKEALMQIKPRDIEQAEMARMEYRVFVEPGVTREDLVEPEAWAHVGHQLKINDRIEVLSEDGKVFADLLVASSGVNFAKVRIITFVKFEDEISQQDDDNDFAVEFVNNRYKYGVKRKSDNQWLMKELSTHADAEQWLSNHRKALAA